jgi:hypothetical protein
MEFSLNDKPLVMDEPLTGSVLKNVQGISVGNGESFKVDKNGTTIESVTPGSLAGAITAAMTSIAAINPADGEINYNKVGTNQINALAVTEAKIAANAVTAAKTSIAAINSTNGEINANKVGTSQIVAGSVTSEKSNLSLRGWTQTCVFTSASATQVNWGAGTFTASDGTSYSIGAGNTGTMSAKNYIYLDIAISTTAYQKTTTATTAVGDGKVLIAIAQNNTTEAVFQVLNNNSSNIDASNIVTGSLTANEIAAGAITSDKISAGAVTASKITSYNFQLSAGSFANNSPGSGKIAWTGCKVVYNGTEHSITNGNCDTTDKHIYWQLASPTVFAVSATLPALGNDDFLVAFNNSGTASMVWNSTVINGNRITAGSVVASNLAAGTITANEIAANAITADEIAAGAVTAVKLTTYNFLLSAGTFTNNSPTAGYVAWTNCKVVYNGTEHTITNGNSNKKHIYWQLASPTVFAGSDTLPALGNDDFLVSFNNAGANMMVWNSTVINGNRITAGSIAASSLVANTITANELNTALLYAGTFTLDTAGAIKSGKTAYTDDTNAGFWLGDVGGVKKLNIGSSSTKYLHYDGTDFTMVGGTITGGILQTATTGARVKINGSTGRIEFLYDDTVKGYISPDASKSIIIGTDDNVYFYEGNNWLGTFTDGNLSLPSGGAIIIGGYTGDTPSSDKQFVTSLRLNGGNLQWKGRTIQFKGGIMTSMGSESDWYTVS